MRTMNRLILALLLIAVGSGLPAIAQTQISGPQSGTMGPGIYSVIGDIKVFQGTTLTIMPGTEFQHNGNWTWDISGQFTAVGAEGDSIRFVRQSPVEQHRWGGIRFRAVASGASRIDHCVIDNCYVNSGIIPPWQYGGGIYVDTVPISVTNTQISHCDAYWHGGAIYALNAGILVDHCTLVANEAIDGADGGAIFLYGCMDATITHNIIARNISTGT